MKKGISGKKVFILIIVSGLILVLAADLGFTYLDSLMVGKIRGCELKTKEFQETIPFEMVGGYMVVEAKVSGNDQSFPFIFDSSSRSIFTDSLLLEVSNKDYKVYAGENRDTLEHAFNDDFICMNQLQIGRVQFVDVGALTAYGSKWGALNCISPYGVIGYNVIGSCTVQVDYEKQQIILTDQVETLPNYSNISWTGYQPFGTELHPIIYADLDGQMKLDLYVNTGSPQGAVLSSDSLYHNLQKNARAIAFEFLPTVRIHGESNDVQKALLFDAVNIDLTEAIHVTTPISILKQPEKVFEGYLGNRFLRNFNLTFDRNRLGLISVPKKVVEDATPGVQCTLDGGKVVISVVATESRVAQDGVEVGDTVQSIQGIDPLRGIPCVFMENNGLFDFRGDSLISVEILHSDTVMHLQLTPDFSHTLFE